MWVWKIDVQISFLKYNIATRLENIKVVLFIEKFGSASEGHQVIIPKSQEKETLHLH